MNSVELARQLRDPLAFAREHGLIRETPPVCAACQKPMRYVKDSSRKLDGFIWRCPQHKGRKVSVRARSWSVRLSRVVVDVSLFRFESSDMAISDCIRTLYYWSCETAVTTMAYHMRLSTKSAVCWYERCRELASSFLGKPHNRPLLGGVGCIVEIDESAVRTPKHHSRGHPGAPRWVLGLICRETGDAYLQFVQARDKETLQAIIAERVAPGTTIYTDGWRAYRGLDMIQVQPPFTHRVVNHRAHFIDRATGVHTNNVEAMWKAAKASFKRMNGVSSERIQSHLDEWLFRKKIRNMQNDPKKPHYDAVFNAALAEIASSYDVNA